MNAGLRTLAENLWLLHPTEAAAQLVPLGPYALEVARDAPIAPPRGLVAFSHGGGSTPWVHRGLLAHLARAGYAVVALEHPGNNRRDNRLQTPDGVPLLANLEARPRDLRAAIDAARALLAESGRAWLDAPVAEDARAWLDAPVAVIGESIGGYTALALAGGQPRSFPDDVPHARRMAPAPEDLARVVAVDVVHDPRVAAVVLLSPALWFFAAAPAVPALVRCGARDPITPPASIRALFPDAVVVPDAGHFSFQTPFPPALAHLPPAQDPPGFDRAGYQPTLYADVTAFLDHQMSRRT